MIKKTFALTLSLSVSAQLAAQTETDYLSGMTPECRQNNPNIVFILLDDAGYGDLIGKSELKMPNIQQMAENGLVFTDHYSGAPVSAPSRCALMTGKHTGHAVIRGNKGYYPEGQEALPLTEKTIASIIKENTNYRTALFGKWGLGGPNSPGWEDGDGDPLHHGFDRFYGYLCQLQAHSYYPSHLWEGKDGKWRKDELDHVYSHTLITENALNFIEESQNQKMPYFLYVAYTIPHSLLQIPKEYVEEFYGDKAWPALKKNFAAMMSLADRDIGRILQTVDPENTIIFFSSDNGPHREGGGNPKWFQSSGGFRGIKRDVYEGGIRLPLIAWGKNIQKGTSEHVCAFWDFLPTVVDILGIQTQYPTDGISYAPTLFGKGKQKEHPYLYWEFHEQGGKQAVRKENWKLVRLKAFSNRSVFELYDLSTDPKERKNLIRRYPEKAEELKEIMRKAHIESEIFPGIQPIPTAELR